MKKASAKHVVPKYVSTEIDLKCALKTGELVIVSSDESLFVELESQLKKKQTSTKTKKGSSLVAKIGSGLFVISLFIPGLNGAVLMGELAVAGIGGLGKLIGSALDDFKNYALVADYENKRILLLRIHGSPSFDQGIDTIEGINLKHILEHNE